MRYRKHCYWCKHLDCHIRCSRRGKHWAICNNEKGYRYGVMIEGYEIKTYGCNCFEEGPNYYTNRDNE